MRLKFHLRRPILIGMSTLEGIRSLTGFLGECSDRVLGASRLLSSYPDLLGFLRENRRIAKLH